MEKQAKRECGAVTIIEAAFVFPITFFIVFFMIMAGEAYYQYARVEREITVAAINGAARCENPMLGSVISSGAVQTDPTALDVIPYRYILTGQAKRIASDVEAELLKKISGFKALMFRNMSPKNISVSVKLHMNVLVSSFPVSCSFEIPFPIRMIFTNQSLHFSYSVQTNAPISDPSEFVRNVGLIGDLLERNKAAREFGEKAKGAMQKIGGIIN